MRSQKDTIGRDGLTVFEVEDVADPDLRDRAGLPLGIITVER